MQPGRFSGPSEDRVREKEGVRGFITANMQDLMRSRFQAYERTGLAVWMDIFSYRGMIRAQKEKSPLLRECIAWRTSLVKQISLNFGDSWTQLTLLGSAWRATERSDLFNIACRGDHFDVVKALHISSSQILYLFAASSLPRCVSLRNRPGSSFSTDDR